MDDTRRKFLFRAGKIAAVVLGGAYLLKTCDQIPDSAAEAWEGPKEDEEDIRLWALSYAILAPSQHNMQPWLVDLRIEDDLIRLFMDEERLLKENDPYSRETGMAMGGFIESLVIAASERGYRAEVTYLPEGNLSSDSPGKLPVADIRLVEDENVHPDPLFEYLLQRRTNRQLYLPSKLEAEHRELLSCAMAAHRMPVSFINRKRLVNDISLVAAKAVGVQMVTPATMKESIDTTRIGGGSIGEGRDGRQLNGIPVWWLQKTGRLSEGNASTPGSWGYNTIFASETSHLAATPEYAIFESAGDSREGQLAMGRAYLRFNLLAAQLGVSVHPVNHVLADYEAMAETRKELYQVLNKAPYRKIHMLVRLGYALEDVPAPTARRPLEDIILAEERKNGQAPDQEEAS